jgi:hypothetical protein
MGDDPLPLRSALLDGARRLGLENPIEVARVFGGWQELVGDQVAARCEPAGLSRGVLRVWAATPAWAVELRYLAPEVIRRVNGGVGAGVVRELKVAVRPAERTGGPSSSPRRRVGTRPEGEDWERARPPAPRRVTRVAGAGIDADELVAPIADERLAAATKRALLAAKTHSETG